MLSLSHLNRTRVLARYFILATISCHVQYCISWSNDIQKNEREKRKKKKQRASCERKGLARERTALTEEKESERR